jgi:uncharacterized protein YdeI (YjbR/CyaY-like superfamily)
MKPIFFATPNEFRGWLEKNHHTAPELLVGLCRKGAKRAGMTWREAVGEALCFGWIDGVRKRLDEESYAIRFTPRRNGSTWSAVNIARVVELTRAGKMQPAGEAAFARRKEAKSRTYSYEQAEVELPAEAAREFRAHAGGWKFFQAQPPWYRRTATWWVISAKRPETRRKRLTTLIEDSAAGRTLRQFTRQVQRNA